MVSAQSAGPVGGGLSAKPFGVTGHTRMDRTPVAINRWLEKSTGWGAMKPPPSQQVCEMQAPFRAEAGNSYALVGQAWRRGASIIGARLKAKTRFSGQAHGRQTPSISKRAPTTPIGESSLLPQHATAATRGT